MRFKEAEDKYRKVVSDAGLWAEPRNAFAWFLIQRGITVEPAKGNVKLKEAAEICQGTLALNQRGKSPRDWASDPEQSGHSRFKNSGRAAAEKKAASCSKTPLPLIAPPSRSLPRPICLRIGPRPRTIWASRFKNSGRAAAGEEGRKLLEDAVAAYRSALEVYTKADLPQDWAMTQNNLGTALQELGTRSGGEEGRKLLEDAVAAFRSALEVFTKADLPQYWAMTQNNLGNALQELGTRSGGEEGRKLLEDAVAAYRSALEVYTKADLPQDWAMTQNNLGIAL